MTHRVQENCVPFGPDLADLYDETRPFLPPIDTSKVLRKLCEQLTTRFAAESVVDLLEVGAGTGRLTLPIARHYHQLATGSERNVPRLRVTCIDRSEAMLDRLRKRHKSFVSEHVEIVARQPADVRDIQQPRGSYHAVVAHWVFHVMSDWRVAVYVIDQVLKDDGLVFLFREEAALYQAIDGDFREIQEDLLVLRLWSAFHDGRQSIAKRLASEGPVLPARFRLGSRVIDDRIERMFSALGWTETMELSDEPDRWRCTFTLMNVIEKIIRPRAFTNMRLFADEGQARKEFEQLADDLRTQFTENSSSTRGTFGRVSAAACSLPPEAGAFRMPRQLSCCTWLAIRLAAVGEDRWTTRTIEMLSGGGSSRGHGSDSMARVRAPDHLRDFS